MGILIVDDEQVALTSVKRVLQWQRYTQIDICNSGKEAIKRIKSQEYDVVLLDILMPEVDGLTILKTCKPYRPHTEFIMLSAVDDVSTAMKAVRLGAFDYLVKPVDNERLLLSLERAFERRGMRCGVGESYKTAKIGHAFGAIITNSPQMKRLIAYADVMARSGNPVLITGESGTGKELMAKAIHKAGPTPDGPFVPVNVSTVPESMFESLFFGHKKGAFTGADQDYSGYFENANGGSLFLDEIGEIPVHLQVKFLRVLEENSITMLGDTKQTPIHTRIISATNVEIDTACQQGRFRLDLLYRLKSAHIHLPPLRERKEDIALLVNHYLQASNNRYKREIQGISEQGLALLQQYDFPGNVRELGNLIENAVMLCEGQFLSSEHLSIDSEKRSFAPLSSRSLCTFKEDYEQHFAFIMLHTNGDRQQAADILGVSLRQIHRKIAQLEKEGRPPYIGK